MNEPTKRTSTTALPDGSANVEVQSNQQVTTPDAMCQEAELAGTSNLEQRARFFPGPGYPTCLGCTPRCLPDGSLDLRRVSICDECVAISFGVV